MEKQKQGKKKKKGAGWRFPAGVGLLYLLMYAVDGAKTTEALLYALGLFKTIAPILLLVLAFMFLFNMINEKKLQKAIEGSPRLLQHLVMVLLGTFSHGPIYAWYPLMADFREKGVSHGSIAAFLYARGIKLSLLPMLALYFGAPYAAALTAAMLVFAFVQALLVDLAMKG